MNGSSLALGAVGLLALAGAQGSRSSEEARPAYNPHEEFVLHGADLDVVITGAPEQGLGSTSAGSNVMYLGWVVWMTPRQFLKLNPPRIASPLKIIPLVRAGEKIAMPFLDVTVSAPGLDDVELRDLPKGTPLTLEVRSHEGRGRMIAISDLVGSDVLVPVAILPRHDYRARDFRPDLIYGATLKSDPRTETQFAMSLDRFAWMGRRYGPS